MITVVIPTLDAEAGLGATLSALVPAAVEGLVREVVVVDGGSTDRTLKIADACGAELLRAERGRGQQLRAGAEVARQPWLLFLHADTVLAPGWEREVWSFIEKQEKGAPVRAAAFRFALDDSGLAPRFLEIGVALRSGLLRLPYGDQGLLISQSFYRDIGGFAPIPLMEDVDIVRRIGRRRMTILRSEAVTSAARYQRDGYASRVLRNLSCLVMYFCGFSIARITRIYGA